MRWGELEQRRRIQVLTLPANSKMQVWRGGAASTAAQRQKLSTIDFVAFLDLELRKMKVERNQALAMVHRHAIAFEVKRSRQDDGAGVGRVNGCSGGYTKIQTLMLVLLHAVISRELSQRRQKWSFSRSLKGAAPKVGS